MGSPRCKSADDFDEERFRTLLSRLRECELLLERIDEPSGLRRLRNTGEVVQLRRLRPYRVAAQALKGRALGVRDARAGSPRQPRREPAVQARTTGSPGVLRRRRWGASRLRSTARASSTSWRAHSSCHRRLRKRILQELVAEKALASAQQVRVSRAGVLEPRRWWRDHSRRRRRGPAPCDSDHVHKRETSSSRGRTAPILRRARRIRNDTGQFTER